MNGSKFDGFARQAGGAVSRRASLRPLGALALLAAVGRPAETNAAKAGKKARNKARKKCQQQVAACQTNIEAICGDDVACLDVLPCCDEFATCQAGKVLDCIFAPPAEN